MEQWLDSLSEDWVSQPRSQPGSSSLPTSPRSSEIGSSSRIPKPKSVSISTGRRDGSHKDVLKARTPSQINSSGLGPASSLARPSSTKIASASLKSQAKGAASPSLRGTVQQKTTSSKGPKDQATPEWKRRLVNGKKGASEETDLLSPKGSGLEKVFKPPTIRNKEAPKGISRRRALTDEKKDDAAQKVNNDPEVSVTQKIGAPSTPTGSLRQVVKPQNSTNQLSVGRRSSIPADPQSILISDESQSDNFSPALLSKVTAPNGQIHYTATPSPKKRVSVHDHAEQQKRSMSLSSAIGQTQAQTPSLQSEDSVAHHALPDLTSQSLPDDLSVGTDAFIANGGFVETNRGGYAENDSFRERLLSSMSSSRLDGPSLKESTGSQNRSMQRSSPRTKRSESPKTPSRKDDPQKVNPTRLKSSGSPLKLFDNYDSFTNDRLLRRMNKFEETLAQDADSVDEHVPRSASPSPGPKNSRNTQQRLSKQQRQMDSRVSSFGEGDLNDFPFPDPPEQEPSLPRYPRATFDETSKVVPLDPTSSTRRRSKGHMSQKSKPLVTQVPDTPHLSTPDLLKDDDPPMTQGKRLRRSPLKGSSPKRRRTIENSSQAEIEFASHMHHHAEPRLTPVKSLLGRKRKDARYEKEDTIADPEILAMRQMRRPRNPTPNQASSSDRRLPSRMSPYSPRYKTEKDRLVSGAVQDRSTHILADVLATNALHTAQKLANGSRKPSVTTDDYFNEAQAIMNLIRSENRPRSSHDMFNQSHIEHQTIVEESMFFESTRDNFSRPPSRDGSVRPRSRALPSLDARAVSQLRKFEDHDDLDLALGNSVKTLRLTHSRTGSVSDQQCKASVGESDVESDPPNVRIRDRPEEAQYHAYRLDAKSNHQRQDSEESEPSSGRSIPTRSSANSSNRMVIAPESVAHLLNDRIAGMTFDRERQKWVKAKQDQVTIHSDLHGEAGDSDDDLFDSIPDLSVDEMEELQRVRDAVVESQSGRQGQKILAQDHQPSALPQRQTKDDAVKDDGRPRTAEGRSIPPADDSSAPSKFSHFAASSAAYASTRATSWGAEDMWTQKLQPAQAPDLAPVAEHTGHHSIEEVEHEISIMEGRVTVPPNQDGDRSRKARVVTVTFSSPVVNQMHSPVRAEHSQGSQDASLESPSWQEAVRQSSSHRRSQSASVERNATRKSASRRMSFDDRPPPMSRLDENDEFSLVHVSSNGRRTLDLAITTPLPLCRSLLAPSSSSHHSSLGFKLSPLQDFTVHQVDRSLDGETGAVVKASRSQDLSTPSKKLSLTAQEVIKALTDLEPYEPYWEYIRSVDLQGRALKSVHMLDEFCGQLVHLNIARNNLNELNGVPSSVRLLEVQNNCLCDLSSWHHLSNVQFLDVSENGLTSLKGLWSLVHLRGLKVDGNGIDSLTGLEGLDGLMSLSARGNRLGKLDFEDYDLTRLVDLDLSGNSIVELVGLERLAALKSLSMTDNLLESLSPMWPLTSLEDLDLSGNPLTSLDVFNMPYLRRLNIDQTSVQSLQGIDLSKSLSHLSLRSQRTQRLVPIKMFTEVQHLHLSSNPIPIFKTPLPFLNLQTLELASCGLQALSSDFGVKCPNLRSLNLNFNALRDLQSLKGIVKLESLYLAGNRISKLRRTTKILEDFDASLRDLDLRDNSLTLGFYVPTSSKEDERGLIAHPSNGSDRKSEGDSRWHMQFVLPAPQSRSDSDAADRLDEATRVRRRVYEMLITGTCGNLKTLDGLEVDREKIGEQDEIWARLKELGVLKEVNAV